MLFKYRYLLHFIQVNQNEIDIEEKKKTNTFQNGLSTQRRGGGDKPSALHKQLAEALWEDGAWGLI